MSPYSPDENEEKVYENNRRKKYLHAFKRIAYNQKENAKLLLEIQRNNQEITTIQDDIIDWILHEQRKDER